MSSLGNDNITRGRVAAILNSNLGFKGFNISAFDNMIAFIEKWINDARHLGKQLYLLDSKDAA